MRAEYKKSIVALTKLMVNHFAHTATIAVTGGGKLVRDTQQAHAGHNHGQGDTCYHLLTQVGAGQSRQPDTRPDDGSIVHVLLAG